MAVQAHHQYLAHAFPHDSRDIRPELDDATAMLGGHLPTAAAALQAVGSNTAAFGDLTCDKTSNYGAGGNFVPRKRARVGDLGLIVEGHGPLLPPLPAAQQQQQAFAPTGDVHQSCRVLCSAAASTSGRTSSGSLLSLLYRHDVEIDALVRIENERLRAELEAARRRHVRAVVSAVERRAARRIRDIEAELGRAMARNAELEQRIRQMGAEGQAWQGVAKSHEAVAAGLRATLDQLLLQYPRSGAGTSTAPMGEGGAEDAQSCCFEEQEDGACDARARACRCRVCGEADACVLLLPCRHLCLCAGCEPAVDACPVCAATKNASLHVLLS